MDDAMAWADAEEAKEKEATEKPSDPTQDPENIRWMEEQMQKAKEQYGDTFGEDISEDFTDE